MKKLVKQFATLYGKSRTGKIKEWCIRIVKEIGFSKIITTHGYQNGNKQEDIIHITEGKNIGKKNETTHYEQAISEAKSKWNSKQDSGYSQDINKIPQNILPMLAKDFNKYKHKMKFPCYAQPKLDGVRCLAKRVNGDIEFISRKGKKFETIEHINTQLKQVMKIGEVFDGEIYLHNTEFQDIISAVKNVKNKSKSQLDCAKLEYHIYDIADNTMDFKNRNKRLTKVKGSIYLVDLEHLTRVQTLICENEGMVKVLHDRFVEEGYEGVILRNKKGGYDFDYRSDNLQKYKEFKDEEYEIINVKCGKGRYKDCGCFVCKTKDGKEFNVNPEGTLELKQEYLKNKDKHIGQLLTVKFQEKSKDGIPRFPVGLSVRDYE